MDDFALLKQYADTGSEEAFQDLVQRHIAVVYSAARRQVGDAAAADATQAVFLLLARKAGKLRSKTILTAWLLTTTRFVARAMLRSEARRRHWEQEAATMSFHNPSTEVQVAWEKVQPLLDEALAALPQADRGLVALRFFEHKSHAEIATTLGLSEEASKKRLSRAVEKLRGFFSKRGVTLGAVVLLAAISEHAVQAAPAGLASQITAASTAGASVTVAALVKATLKLMTWTKMKFIGASVAVGLAVATVPIAVTLSAADSDVTIPDGRDVKLERYEFKAVPVRYTMPSSGPQPMVVIAGPGKGGERLLSAEFSWEVGPAHPPAMVMRVAVADELGNEFDPLVQDANTQDAGGRQYWVAEIPTFPRRGKRVYLRLMDNGNLLAEFKIPNPAAGPHPEWTAQRLPVKATDHDLDVTLMKFVAHHPSARTNTDAQRNEPHTECVFSFRENQRDTTAWVPELLEVTDATGNHWTVSHAGNANNPYEAKLENGAMRVELLGALWPGESAWKLRGEFKRVAEFPEPEVLRLSKIRLPDGQEVSEPRTRQEWNGATIELAALMGTNVDESLGGKAERGNASLEERMRRVALMNSERRKGCVTVVLNGEILSRKRRLTFISATDERGNPFELVSAREPGNLEATRAPVPFSFLLRPPAGARELNLAVGVSESRFLEYVAKPEQVKE